MATLNSILAEQDETKPLPPTKQEMLARQAASLIGRHKTNFKAVTTLLSETDKFLQADGTFTGQQTAMDAVTQAGYKAEELLKIRWALATTCHSLSGKEVKPILQNLTAVPNGDGTITLKAPNAKPEINTPVPAKV